ncbi:MAG: ABC transporter permease [Elusimicrobiaceae bacterium]|nr:ABC transporter permease [Elusimicrobiaceae bacterium]
MFKKTGKFLIFFFTQFGQATEMIKDAAFWFWKTPLEVNQTLQQIVKIGVESVPVILMTGLFVGMVLALQAGNTMQSILSEPLYIGLLVSFSLVRELGPVLTAFVISGRAGAAVTAEIGTMKVTEQIDALSTLGTNAIRYLVIPRLIAFTVSIPILTIFSIIMGIFGGYIVSVEGLGVPSSTYTNDILTYLGVDDLMHGLIKATVFAFILGVICCYKGLNTRGGAEGVGKSTTGAVVVSMVMILVIDYFLTAILHAFGV